MNEDNEECKSLLIVNESNDAKVTLYIYRTWLPIPTISKVIQPNERYLHREKQMFKFKLVANFDDERKKKELSDPLELIRDTLIRVTKSLKLIKENLADYPNTSGKVNLYDILGLDMEVVRKLNIDDQKKAIDEAFRDQIRISHPDKNGDDETAMQIIVAKEILLNDERRARYHNETDYDKGWLSHQQLQAIFWPDCYTEEQNKAYWHRIGLMGVSSGLAIGGNIVTALTADAEAPAVVVCGAVFGGGLTRAGILSGKHTITKDSVLNKCDTKSFAIKAGMGFLDGAVAAGVAALTKTVKQPEEATFRCKSEGAWDSKMIVTYLLNGKEEVNGSGKTVKIPLDAKQLEVRFQVRHPFWRNIKKYDRFTKTWCKPYEPHVFRYEKPPLERTFTISGYLGWEAVMRVSDEYHEETGEMVGDILKTDMKTAGKYLSLMSGLYFSLCSLGCNF